MNTNNPFWLKVVLTSLFFSTTLLSQSNVFYLTTYWEVHGEGMAFNIEAFDMNKDTNLDIVVGNWNDTYVYFGGSMLDSFVDITYTGRMLAVCDYNGDGFDDLIAMHFTNFDSVRYDYDGEILFYWGSDTSNIGIDTIADYIISLPTLIPTLDGFAEGYGTKGTQYGDFNNDSKSDLVFRSFNYGQFGQIGTNVGKIYVYMGNETPPIDPDFTAEGKFVLDSIYSNNYGTYFQAGNINGDEFDDLLFSSHLRTDPPGSQDSLAVLHIFYGSENFRVQTDSESVRYESRINPQLKWAEWFNQTFSVDDINGDGIDDLVVGRYGFLPTVVNVHYGKASGIDTIPSFTFTDIDSTDPGLCACGISENIGDFNSDGYDDFILRPAGYSIFSLHLGGPYVSNGNPYGLRGLAPLISFFPKHAVSVGDQNNDGFSDFVAISGGSQYYTGYIDIMLGLNKLTFLNENQIQTVLSFELFPNHPNPFNNSTIISFQLTEMGAVKLMIFDALGQEVTILLNEEVSVGHHQIEFNADKYHLGSGVYFCNLQLNGKDSSSIKLIYLK